MHAFRPISFLAAVLVAAAFASCGDDEKSGIPAAVVRVADGPALLKDRAVRIGAGPTAVAINATNVFVADGPSGTLHRIDSATGRSAGPPSRVPGGPLALAASAGVVWVVSGTGDVTRLRPGTRAKTVTNVPGAAKIALAAGHAWVSSTTSGTVTRLDERTGRRAGAPVRVGRGPADVVSAAGAVWVANGPDGTVSRIDPKTVKVTATTRVAKDQVLALAGNASGVWVAKTDSPTAEKIDVLRLDPSSASIDPASALRITSGQQTRLAAGMGSVWAIDTGNLVPGAPRRAAALLRIDPEARAVRGPRTPTGASPTALAVGAGGVWVTSAADGTVTRYRLPG